MTAPQVPLEPQEPNPLLEPNPNEPNPDPNSPNPPLNQPTNPPAKSYTEEDLKRTHDLYGSALQEAEGKRKDLEKQLEDANRNRQAPIDDSNLSPEQLIERHVAKSVKPLLDEFSQFRQSQQATTYQTLKNQFRTMPNLAPYFTQMEPYIDQDMQGKEPTAKNLQDTIARVIGLAMMQGSTGQNNNQPNNNQPQNNPQNNQPQNQNTPNNMLPPHVRPSNPPPPNRQNGGKVYRQLTELEKRVAREQGKTPEQYLDWLDVPPDQVVNSRIGLPEVK
jgi:hypothetical protein